MDTIFPFWYPSAQIYFDEEYVDIESWDGMYETATNVIKYRSPIRYEVDTA